MRNNLEAAIEARQAAESALAAEVEAVLADEASLVCTDTAACVEWTVGMKGESENTPHWREPLPNLQCWLQTS